MCIKCIVYLTRKLSNNIILHDSQTHTYLPKSLLLVQINLLQHIVEHRRRSGGYWSVMSLKDTGNRSRQLRPFAHWNRSSTLHIHHTLRIVLLYVIFDSIQTYLANTIAFLCRVFSPYYIVISCFYLNLNIIYYNNIIDQTTLFNWLISNNKY